MTGAQATYGGIASTNRNFLHALIDVAQTRKIGLTVFSFLEKDSDRPAFAPNWLRFTGFEANKIKLSIDLLSVARHRPLLCFDHVRLALPVLALAATGLVQTVICAHGSESWRRLRRTSRWSFQSAALCLANSQFTLDKMRQRMPQLNASACPLGLSREFDLNHEVPERLQKPIVLEAADRRCYALGDRALLLVGRMHPNEREKGHYQLIKVLPQVLQRHPDVQLVLAGPGDDRANLQLLAQSQGVGAAVFLPGWLTNPDLERLYRHCYAFVMPSRQEGFGLAYLEAMNYAKPCVGCSDQGAQDIIVDGETGYLVDDPDDSGKLVEVLHKLLSDPGQAHTLGRQGLARLHEHFTAHHYQQRVREQILRLL